MLRRLRLVLIALDVALAATLPAGARTMPMSALTTGSTVHPPCSNRTPAGPCRHGMPACPVLACVGAAAVLPARTVLPGRAALPTAYAVALHVRWRSALPDPDPIPPRPVALV